MNFKDDYQREAEPTRRLIYCSLGSYLTPDRQFLKRTLAVAERRSDWVFILGLGGQVDMDGFASVPANVLVLNWAPQLDVLKIADCAVIHAGISTINECIYCQVPMLVHSTHTVDQDGTAARVAFHRLGIVADKRRDYSEQIEGNIERVLMDETIRRNLAAMQGYFLTYETSNVAERCPTGALTYEVKQQGGKERPDEENTVTVSYNGPYFIRGDLAIGNAPGDMPGVSFRAALCRCGACSWPSRTTVSRLPAPRTSYGRRCPQPT